MSKNKNVLQKGSALAEGEDVQSRDALCCFYKKYHFLCLLLFLQIKKYQIISPQSLTLAEGEAAWCAREGSHRQGGCVGQRRRDTGEGKILTISKKKQ